MAALNPRYAHLFKCTPAFLAYICICVSVSLSLSVSVCACVCVREREREIDVDKSIHNLFAEAEAPAGSYVLQTKVFKNNEIILCNT